MLHLSIVHRALDVKHRGPFARSVNIARFSFRCGIRRPSVMRDVVRCSPIHERPSSARCRTSIRSMPKEKPGRLGRGTKSHAALVHRVARTRSQIEVGCLQGLSTLPRARPKARRRDRSPTTATRDQPQTATATPGDRRAYRSSRNATARRQASARPYHAPAIAGGAFRPRSQDRPREDAGSSSRGHSRRHRQGRRNARNAIPADEVHPAGLVGLPAHWIDQARHVPMS